MGATIHETNSPRCHTRHCFTAVLLLRVTKMKQIREGGGAGERWIYCSFHTLDAATCAECVEACAHIRKSSPSSKTPVGDVNLG